MSERINIIFSGPIFSLSGYGRHSCDLVMGLFQSGKYNISILPTGWGTTSSYQARKDVDDALIFMCNNRIGDNVPFVWMQVGVPHEFKRITKINIGITAGTEAIPYPKKWKDYCNQMTAIIVPSKFVRDNLLEAGVTVPVYIVPEGVDTSVFNNTAMDEPTDLMKTLDNLPTSFNFVTTGQWLNGALGEDRKNIPLTVLSVIDALVEKKDVGIIVKSFLHNNSSPDKYVIQQRFQEVLGEDTKGRVHLIHGTISEDEMKGLYTHPKVKAFVSLTHGEGYFRPLSEAIACDLPVLCTGFGGQMDYLKPELSTVLEYGMIDLPQTVYMPELLLPGQRWAVVDHDKAKNKIRRCYENYPIAKDRAIKLGEIIRRDFSLEKSTKILLEVMNNIVGNSAITPGKMGSIII